MNCSVFDPAKMGKTRTLRCLLRGAAAESDLIAQVILPIVPALPNQNPVPGVILSCRATWGAALDPSDPRQMEDRWESFVQQFAHIEGIPQHELAGWTEETVEEFLSLVFRHPQRGAGDPEWKVGFALVKGEIAAGRQQPAFMSRPRYGLGAISVVASPAGPIYINGTVSAVADTPPPAPLPKVRTLQLKIENTRASTDAEPFQEYLTRKTRERLQQWKLESNLRNWPLHCGLPVEPEPDIDPRDSRKIKLFLKCTHKKCGHLLTEAEALGRS